ncbi:7704_t:CDS:2 [Diversispora eburnea]|uniref:7704_t:CDS:1 n=1 Tax=Diversispora eburnea TaxID=1213867 RepID=A0A9N9ARC0_9GLOM|nr:7704_t:CDS:2 [Diversispora eburnea]
MKYIIVLNNGWKTIKSLKNESSLLSSISHPRSCYISRSIHALHGFHNSLEDIKSGKSQDPNLLKFKETSTSSVIHIFYNNDSKEPQECIDWEKIKQKDDLINRTISLIKIGDI